MKPTGRSLLAFTAFASVAGVLWRSSGFAVSSGAAAGDSTWAALELMIRPTNLMALMGLVLVFVRVAWLADARPSLAARFALAWSLAYMPPATAAVLGSEPAWPAWCLSHAAFLVLAGRWTPARSVAAAWVATWAFLALLPAAGPLALLVPLSAWAGRLTASPAGPVAPVSLAYHDVSPVFEPLETTQPTAR